MGTKRIVVICGYDHVQEGLEERIRAAGLVETHEVGDQSWYNLEWTRRPYDQSIVDGWVEEHARKKFRLGMK